MRLATVVALAGILAIAIGSARADEWDDAGEEVPGRSFLYRELVLTGFYSDEGVVGVPPGDTTRDHIEFSRRPPGNYAGFDYIRTFTDASRINRDWLPDWLPLTAIDLHPRVVLDRMEGDSSDQFKFAPQDFWLRLNPGGHDRLSLRIGQFVIPYGVNPILAPRQRFILPLEATDLGLKWDWGLSVKGPLGEYDWELATTIGSGETLHSPRLFQGSERESYLFTGRLGAPTYWDLQYGLSFLYGDLPMIRPHIFNNDVSISRWRVGLDAFYRFGTYLMAGAQATFGQDGFGDDKQFMMMTGGQTADVLGYRAWADWVVPTLQDLRLAAQFESVIRDLSTSDLDDTALIFEAGYSLLTSVTVRADYRMELNGSMGEESDAIFLSFIYYAS